MLRYNSSVMCTTVRPGELVEIYNWNNCSTFFFMSPLWHVRWDVEGFQFQKWRWVLSLVVNTLAKMPTSHFRVSGFDAQLWLLLLIPVAANVDLRSHQWWLKWLGSCYPRGRLGISFCLLVPVPVQPQLLKFFPPFLLERICCPK